MKMQSTDDENDFSEYCRVCAKKVKSLVSLFHTKRKENTMANMLSICLQGNVHQGDGRPSSICLACVPKLMNSFELIYTAKNSEHFFHQQIVSKLCTIPKVEPEDMDDYQLYDDLVCEEAKLTIPTEQSSVSFIKTEINEDITNPDPLDGSAGGAEVQIDPNGTVIAGIAVDKPNIKIKPKHDDKKEISNKELVQLFTVKRTRIYECYVCKRSPFTPKRLRQHLKAHDKRRPFKCFVCGEGYKYKPDLDKHLCQGNTIRCEYCPAEFSSLNEILVHLKNHDEKLLYQCMRCTKGFSLKSLHKFHKTLHDHFQFACKICGKTFGTKQSTANHTRMVHTNERPHLCAICGKGYKDKSTLKKHSIVHNGEKPFRCLECPMRFFRKGALTVHMTVHRSEKHVCPECGRIMKSKSSLRSHLARHGERTKQCELCIMKFHTNDSLRTHMRKHTGEKPFKCKYCEVAYSQSNDLNKHIRIHVGQNTYKCTVCTMSFRYFAELRAHASMHSPIEPDVNKS